MARGSIVKRKSGNYAIVYYVGGKQKWETIGPSRREAERALTARKREVDTGRGASRAARRSARTRSAGSPTTIRPASAAAGDGRVSRRRRSRAIA